MKIITKTKSINNYINNSPEKPMNWKRILLNDKNSNYNDTNCNKDVNKKY